jgi:metal-sulfur cluster biosynthetic enzyme
MTMNRAPLLREQKTNQVWGRLAFVMDPELDEPVTELGFIELVSVSDDDVVDIVFRLPTYWCSPNFAFMMADDMRRAVSSLQWVRVARPQLRDHMVAEEINRGVSDGRSFGEALSAFASGGSLNEVREKFRRKAFQRRQESMILAMRELGYDDQALCSMSLYAYDQVEFGARKYASQKSRYREILVERDLASLPSDLVFVTYDGYPIKPQELAFHLQRLRAIRINMEFNSALCRGLLADRYRNFDLGCGARTAVDATPCVSCGSDCAGQP